jgi:hypothetical protein
MTPAPSFLEAFRGLVSALEDIRSADNDRFPGNKPGVTLCALCEEASAIGDGHTADCPVSIAARALEAWRTAQKLSADPVLVSLVAVAIAEVRHIHIGPPWQAREVLNTLDRALRPTETGDGEGGRHG